MKYEDLKTEIKTIADIAAGVPEGFRERCFEVLLEHLLASHAPKGAKQEHKEEESGASEAGSTATGAEIPTPSQVKVLLQKTGLSVEDLAGVVMWEENERSLRKVCKRHQAAAFDFFMTRTPSAKC